MIVNRKRPILLNRFTMLERLIVVMVVPSDLPAWHVVAGHLVRIVKRTEESER